MIARAFESFNFLLCNISRVPHGLGEFGGDYAQLPLVQGAKLEIVRHSRRANPRQRGHAGSKEDMSLIGTFPMYFSGSSEPAGIHQMD